MAAHGWNRWQRCALQWAAVPMIGAAVLLAAFFAVRNLALGLLGIYWIWFGLVVTVAVLVMSGLGWWHARRTGAPARARWGPAAGALLVMALNYPAAYGALLLGDWWWNRSTVVFVNEAGTRFGPLRVVGSGVELTVGALEAGTSTSMAISFRGEGVPAVFDAGKPEPVATFGYVCDGLPIDARVVRRGDGSVAVTVDRR